MIGEWPLTFSLVTSHKEMLIKIYFFLDKRWRDKIRYCESSIWLSGYQIHLSSFIFRISKKWLQIRLLGIKYLENDTPHRGYIFKNIFVISSSITYLIFSSLILSNLNIISSNLIYKAKKRKISCPVGDIKKTIADWVSEHKIPWKRPLKRVCFLKNNFLLSFSQSIFVSYLI